MVVVHASKVNIRKASIGQVGIWLVGIAVIFLLLASGLFLQTSNPQFATLLQVTSLIAVLATLIQSEVYGSSRMILKPNELDVLNQRSLFTTITGTLEWNQVQDIELQVSSLGSIFGYGTLIIHAANDQRDLVFTMTPSPQWWHGYMMKLVESAVVPVHDK